MQNIGQYISELRIKKGIGAEALASYLNILPETLHLIETNHIHATKNQIFSIAAYLGADENDLLQNYQRSRLLSEITDGQKLNDAFQSPGHPKNNMYFLLNCWSFFEFVEHLLNLAV